MKNKYVLILMALVGCGIQKHSDEAKLSVKESALRSETTIHELKLLYNKRSHFNGGVLFTSIYSNGEIRGEFICPDSSGNKIVERSINPMPHSYLSIPESLKVVTRKYAELVCMLKSKYGAYRIYTELGLQNSVIFTFSENRRLLHYLSNRPDETYDINLKRKELGNNWQLLIYE